MRKKLDRTIVSNLAVAVFIVVASAMVIYFVTTQYLLDDALCEAITVGDTKEVCRLIDAGAYVNNDHFGCGMFKGKTVISSSHIEKLSVNSRKYNDRLPMTPLEAACTRNEPDIALLLIKHGANVDQVDGDGFSPLAIAVAFGSNQNVELLLSNGANPNTFDPSDALPLVCAVVVGNKKAVKLLLSHGASPSTPDSHLGTAMDVAVMHNDKEIVAIIKGALAKEVPHLGLKS